MSQKRSAEWLRGAAHAAAECKQFKAAVWYQMLLAEAEAREASVPTAAEVIAAVELALHALTPIKLHKNVADDRVIECRYKAGGWVHSYPAREARDAEIALAAIAKWKEAQR